MSTRTNPSLHQGACSRGAIWAFILLICILPLPAAAQCLEPQYCRTVIHVGNATVYVEGDIGTLVDEGRYNIQRGENATLRFNITSPPDGPPFALRIQVNDTPGITWRREKTVLLNHSPQEGPHLEEFPFRVSPNAFAGRVVLPFSLQVGNETAHAAWIVDIIEPPLKPSTVSSEKKNTPMAGPLALGLAIAAAVVVSRSKRA